MTRESCKFFAVQNIGDTQIPDQLSHNLVSWLDYSFLCTGGFVNVQHPSSGIFGNIFSQLRLVEDPNYTKGQVWETFRSNWIWESGIDYSSQPINISGVYVNGSYKPLGVTGTYSYHLNYPQGRVVFDSPINTTSVVEMDYSYRYVNVYKTDQTNFRELMQNSFRSDSPMYLQYGSGIWSIDSQHRIQHPAVLVELSEREKIQPRQMGAGQYLYKDVLFHIISETPIDRNNLMWVFDLQKEHRIYLYDLNLLAQSGAFPLKIDGSLSAGAQTYPNLVDNYTLTTAYFYDVQSNKIQNFVPGLYYGVVRSTIEVII